ncbi:MAG: biotin transporter BioY [Anaerolineae bacterium]
MHALVIRRTNLAFWTKALAVVLFAVATAISARVSILLPFSPVPLTLQVLVVVSSGLVLGFRGALLAQALYLQAILLGAPVSATGLGGLAAFATPSAGYLLSFPLAAAAAGWVSERGENMRPLRRALGGLCALTIVYVVGTAWLSAYVGGLANAWKLGVLPFVGADVLKLTLATALLSVRGR